MCLNTATQLRTCIAIKVNECIQQKISNLASPIQTKKPVWAPKLSSFITSHCLTSPNGRIKKKSFLVGLYLRNHAISPQLQGTTSLRSWRPCIHERNSWAICQPPFQWPRALLQVMRSADDPEDSLGFKNSRRFRGFPRHGFHEKCVQKLIQLATCQIDIFLVNPQNRWFATFLCSLDVYERKEYLSGCLTSTN